MARTKGSTDKKKRHRNKETAEQKAAKKRRKQKSNVRAKRAFVAGMQPGSNGGARGDEEAGGTLPDQETEGEQVLVAADATTDNLAAGLAAEGVDEQPEGPPVEEIRVDEPTLPKVQATLRDEGWTEDEIDSMMYFCPSFFRVHVFLVVLPLW